MVCPRFSNLSRKSRFIAWRKRLTFSRIVSNAPPVISQPAIVPHSLYALFLLSSLSAADHPPSSAVWCTGAAPGHNCLSAPLPTCISSLCPRSPAQLSSRGGDFLLSLQISMALLSWTGLLGHRELIQVGRAEGRETAVPRSSSSVQHSRAGGMICR